MAAPASQPEPSKDSRRLHAAGKLTALLGLPLALIGSIFGGGLYFGATHSYSLQVFESRYLGLPETHGGPPSSETPEAAQPPSSEAKPTPAPPPSVDTKPPEPKPQPTKPEPAPAKPEPVTSTLAVAEIPPVGPELLAKFDERREVHLKLMVDPALASAREDWPSYTNELFSAVRANFSALFGIDLRLQGVVLWSPIQDTPLTELDTQLSTHDREGAELIVALVARAQPTNYEPAAWTEDVHGDHGLVFAELEHGDPYYHSLLRTLARLFGAQDSTEPGSFMNPSARPAGAAPMLDPSNRGQVIFHKQRPFFTRDGDAQEM